MFVAAFVYEKVITQVHPNKKKIHIIVKLKYLPRFTQNL